MGWHIEQNILSCSGAHTYRIFSIPPRLYLDMFALSLTVLIIIDLDTCSG